MTTKDEAKSKIVKALEATEDALASWRAATASLDGNVVTNGYGILRDPFELRAKLLDARKHIEDGLAHLAGGKWPTNADYDDAEGSEG